MQRNQEFKEVGEMRKRTGASTELVAIVLAVALVATSVVGAHSTTRNDIDGQTSRSQQAMNTQPQTSPLIIQNAGQWPAPALFHV